jgi:hypothetical protein
MMTTFRDARKPTRPRPRPPLSYRLHFPPFQGNPGQLTIWQGRQAQDYEIRTLATDFGIGYSLTKLSIDPTSKTSGQFTPDRTSFRWALMIEWT